MKYIAVANPKKFEGQKEFGPDQVLPNQALSLEQILERFTRGEPVAIGKEPNFDEGDTDLEKIQHMDLVDREEYVEKLKETQKNYQKQEKRKAEAERERIRKQIEEEERKKMGQPGPKAD